MIVIQFLDKLLKNPSTSPKAANAINSVLIFIAGVFIGMLIALIIDYITNHEL